MCNEQRPPSLLIGLCVEGWERGKICYEGGIKFLKLCMGKVVSLDSTNFASKRQKRQNLAVMFAHNSIGST